jgi:hypothetical protein
MFGEVQGGDWERDCVGSMNGSVPWYLILNDCTKHFQCSVHL